MLKMKKDFRKNFEIYELVKKFLKFKSRSYVSILIAIA